MKPGLLLLLVSGVTPWAHGVCAETAGGLVSVKLFQPSAGCGSPLLESPFQLCCTAEGSPRPCRAAASSATLPGRGVQCWVRSSLAGIAGGLQDAQRLHGGL